MYILHKERLIFIHVPKAGGTSIAAALGFRQDNEFILTHATPSQVVKTIFQDDWNQFYSFAVTRSPWERYGSLYRYHKSPEYAALLGRNYSHQLASSFSFNEWMRFNIRSKMKANWFGVPQTYWTKGASEVFQLENLSPIRDILQHKLSREITIPKLNQTHTECMESMEDEAINYIADIDHEIIARFGYAVSAAR